MKMTTWTTNVPLDYTNVIRISITMSWTTTKWLLLFQCCCARVILGITKWNVVVVRNSTANLSYVI